MLFSVLSLLIIFLIVYSANIVRGEKLYIVEGKKDNISFISGNLILNHKTHYFRAPTIKYDGKEIKLKSYKIGYYVNKKTIYEIKSNEDKKSFDLKAVVENESFNVYEPSKDALVFNENVLKNIIDLKFIIVGKTTKNKDFKLEVPLEVSEY